MEQLQDPIEQAAWSEYLHYGSEAYHARNTARRALGELTIHYYDGDDTGEAWVVGTINNRHPNNPFVEHDYDPGSLTLQEIRQHFETYLDQTPKNRQTIIVEGGFESATFSSLETSIAQGAEAGMLSYLGRQSNVDVLSGEPTDQAVYADMEARGVERLEIVALSAIRHFGVLARRKQLDPVDVALDLYEVAANVGVEGFHLVSDDEKSRLDASGEMPQKIQEITDRVIEDLLPNLNETTSEVLKGNDLYNLRDGRVAINIYSDPTDGEAVEEELLPLWHPDSTGRLSEVWRINAVSRDMSLFLSIVRAVNNDKNPFVVFGGPHIVCLEPVLAKYFTLQ